MLELQMIQNGYNEKRRLSNEAIFHNASGSLGIRGSFEEGAPNGAPSVRGAYLNAFCETEPIEYNEKLYGFPEIKQQMVNLPDAQTIKITADGEDLVCWNGKDFTHVLDMKNGVTVRSFTYPLKKGELTLTFTRLVSFIYPELFAVECKIVSRGFDGKITVQSMLNPDVSNFTDSSDPRVASGSGKKLRTIFSDFKGEILLARVGTIISKRCVECSSLHDFEIKSYEKSSSSQSLSVSSDMDISDGQTIVFHKYTAYHELANEDSIGAVDLVNKARSMGFNQLKVLQSDYLDKFWSHARVKVGDSDLQSQIDFCLYSMLSSAGKDGKSNVAAKGLSGEGYEGHYFWDSETYVIPFLLITEPEIAKSLLMYRYNHLEDARIHAKELGHVKGALYPWRTITGSECSSFFPAGSAQYHIDGDIAKAFISYWDISHDESFLPFTCEVLVETARLWLDVGNYVDGKFHINFVTGPDEYSCCVNNNYYTNCCSAENLLGAVRLCEELRKIKGLDKLKEKIALTDEELAEFEKAGVNMFYPFDETIGIIEQDDSFLSKEKWDLDTIPKENFPLLLHYHPMKLYRSQVLKQADSVLANHLYREETPLIMQRSYEFYEKITTHDSSLSNCIYSVMAARLGNLEKAVKYFEKCVGTDTSDHNGNTKDGLHIANMGGVHKALISGFGGLRITKEGISLFPLLPDGFTGLSFCIYYLGSRIKVEVSKNACEVSLVEGDEVSIRVYDKEVKVTNEIKTVNRQMRAVIFDLDGVITDTAKYHYAAWKKIADELHVPFDEKKNEAFKGVSRKRCLELLISWGGLTMTQYEFDDILERKNNIYKDMLSSLTPDSILPGVMDALNMLKKNDIPTALFSVSKNTSMILKYLDMENAFDAVVSGDDISNSKPHFEGYLKAAEKLGVDPRLCIMVEDSSAGIRGARELSLGTVAIMSDNVENADVCISSTSKLEEAIKKLL